MDKTILDRRRSVLTLARRQGFEIRTAQFATTASTSASDSSMAGCTWCEIRGRRVLFIDETQTIAEQILSIRDILESTASIRPHAPHAGQS